MCQNPYDMAYEGSMTHLLKVKHETPPLPIFSNPDLCSLIKPGADMGLKNRQPAFSPAPYHVASHRKGPTGKTSVTLSLQKGFSQENTWRGIS